MKSTNNVVVECSTCWWVCCDLCFLNGKTKLTTNSPKLEPLLYAPWSYVVYWLSLPVLFWKQEVGSQSASTWSQWLVTRPPLAPPNWVPFVSFELRTDSGSASFEVLIFCTLRDAAFQGHAHNCPNGTFSLFPGCFPAIFPTSAGSCVFPKEKNPLCSKC